MSNNHAISWNLCKLLFEAIPWNLCKLLFEALELQLKHRIKSCSVKQIDDLQKQTWISLSLPPLYWDEHTDFSFSFIFLDKHRFFFNKNWRCKFFVWMNKNMIFISNWRFELMWGLKLNFKSTRTRTWHQWNKQWDNNFLKLTSHLLP